MIDDFADSPEFTRNSKLFHQLYIRGRHFAISTITSTQVFKAISPVIRKNITSLMLYRLRNYSDLEAFLDELSAVYNKKTLLQLYKKATDEPYGFLYVDLTARDRQDMFYLCFHSKMIPKKE